MNPPRKTDSRPEGFAAPYILPNATSPSVVGSGELCRQKRCDLGALSRASLPSAGLESSPAGAPLSSTNSFPTSRFHKICFEDFQALRFVSSLGKSYAHNDQGNGMTIMHVADIRHGGADRLADRLSDVAGAPAYAWLNDVVLRACRTAYRTWRRLSDVPAGTSRRKRAALTQSRNFREFMAYSFEMLATCERPLCARSCRLRPMVRCSLLSGLN
jgi:hypothetical protein